MCRTLLCALLLAAIAAAQSPKYKLGRPATPAGTGAVDSFVSPGGKGLPPGRGSASEGRAIYERRCARCHGPDGKGKEEAALVGGQGTLATPKPLKTVGSYWPYATTLFDYIRRAMPFTAPGSLGDDQVYALCAFLLAANGILGQDAVLDRASLAALRMPNRDGFFADPRPGAP